MKATSDNFVWYAPRNQFFYLPTGERWVKTGVEAAIGKQATHGVMQDHAIHNREELEQILLKEINRSTRI